MSAFQELQDQQHEWSNKTFGKNRDGTGQLFHLREEVDEVIDACRATQEKMAKNPSSLTAISKKLNEERFEFADCFLLLIDAAASRGMKMEQLLEYAKAKQEINQKRKWGKPDENGVVNHVK